MTFKKGVSGNPQGRPKKEREVEFRKILLSVITPDEFREMIKVALKMAKKGDYSYTKLLFDHVIGTPIQRQEVSGVDGNAVTIIVKYENAED